MVRPHHHPLTVLIPGEETVRRRGAHVDSQPTLVAVDPAGRARHFGLDAVVAKTRRHSNVILRSPYTTSDVSDPDLTLAFMTWLAEPAISGAHGAGLVLSVPDAPTSTRQAWRAIAAELSGRVVIVPRPIALASGLGLDIDGPAASMVVDLRSDGAEISILAEGGILASSATDDVSPDGLALSVWALLDGVDPDVEGDITRWGIHLVGAGREAGWVARLVGLLRVSIQISPDPGGILMNGIDANRPVVERYLDTVASASPFARVMSRLRVSLSA